jgi:hypothetical protein
MDEARRLIRFVLPGAIFGLMSCVILVCLVPDWVKPRVVFLLQKEAGLGAAVAGLVGSGALGYVFSALHHELDALLIRLKLNRWSTLDHCTFVRAMIKEGKIVVLQGGVALKNTDVWIDRQFAGWVVSAIWFNHLAAQPDFKEADAKSQGVSDTAHALGIARVAAIAAFLVSVAWAAHVGVLTTQRWAVFRSAVGVVSGLAAIQVFWLAYLRVGGRAQRVIEYLVRQSLAQPVTIELLE